MILVCWWALIQGKTAAISKQKYNYQLPSTTYAPTTSSQFSVTCPPFRSFHDREETSLWCIINCSFNSLDDQIHNSKSMLWGGVGPKGSRRHTDHYAGCFMFHVSCLGSCFHFKISIIEDVFHHIIIIIIHASQLLSTATTSLYWKRSGNHHRLGVCHMPFGQLVADTMLAANQWSTAAIRPQQPELIPTQHIIMTYYWEMFMMDPLTYTLST